ncbi:hypothetical protein [uncultured Aquabacterium sp.]|uniref:hypothetical protein n=1 Tax=uncultured Aquabacterium sp. TaxID=158753 RepID=UPI002630CFCD|nr:hypothetical protein [uncultured Aquabacterium sp.]
MPASPTPPSPADPAITGPAPLPPGTDTAKARQREEAALDNVEQGYDDPSGKAGSLSGQPDGDTQGGPGANNDAGHAPPPLKGARP